MKEKIVLVGGGGHCHACIDVIESTSKFEIVGILDRKERIGETILNYSVIGSDDDFEKFISKGNKFHISIGQIKTNVPRKKVFERLIHLDAGMPVIVSHYAIVSNYASIGRGTIIMHNAIINANSIIGENCIINSRALLEHDVIIGSNSHVSTGAILNGGVKIGENSFIGSGTTIIEKIEIGKNVVIGAGCTIKSNVEDGKIIK